MCRVEGLGCRVEERCLDRGGAALALEHSAARQRPASGLEFQVQVCQHFEVVLSSLGSGARASQEASRVVFLEAS